MVFLMNIFFFFFEGKGWEGRIVEGNGTVRFLEEHKLLTDGLHSFLTVVSENAYL